MDTPPEIRNLQHLTLTTMELIQSLETEENKDIHDDLIRDHIENFSQDILEEPQKVLFSSSSGAEWFNISKPLNWKEDLKSTVTVLDFFTYCCVNCLHILPDLAELEEKYKPNESPVLVIGIHSPKFENEKLSSSIEDAISRHHVTHPVVNDKNCQLWNSLHISCWPTIVILGPSCVPLFVLVGEGHREHMLKFVAATCSFFRKQLEVENFPLKPLDHVDAKSSVLCYPGKIIHHNGSLIIADSGNNRILLCNQAGEIQDVIGNGQRSFLDGSYKDCGFNTPQGLAAYNEKIYVADTENHAIRLINTKTKKVETIAGTGTMCTDKEGGMLWAQQGISSPWDVCLCHSLDKSVTSDPPNLLLIAMAGLHQIWGLFLSDGMWLKKCFYEAGSVVRLAGSGAEENRNTSYPLKAGFAQPSGLALLTQNGQQQVFIADSESSSVRQFTLNDGVTKRVIGGGRDPLDLFCYGDKDGDTKEALLQHPVGVAAGNSCIYVADTFNHKIKKITPAEKKLYMVETLTSEEGKLLKLNEPGGLCFVEEENKLAVADTNNHRILIFDLLENESKELSLKFTKKPKSQDTADSPLEDITTLIVPSQKIFILNVNLGFGKEFSFNKDVDSLLTLSSSDAVKTRNQMVTVDKLAIPIEIEILDRNNASIEMDFTLFLCSSTGFCVKKKLFKKLAFQSSDNLEGDSVDLFIEIH